MIDGTAICLSRLVFEKPQRGKWKPVPGFEDYYEVSSHGRIKSLSRERVLPYGSTWLMPEKILNLRVNSQYNKHTGDYTYGFIAVSFLDGISYCHSVARLVYYCRRSAPQSSFM